jgi:hypothetical protein
MTHWSYLETDEERAARETRAEAFWIGSDSEIFSDLILPEEDLPPERRGGAYRWFRSPNVLDLVKVRAGRLSLW